MLLLLLNVIGHLALAASCLKTIEKGPTIGPAFSGAARLVLLLVVFLAVYASIEALAWPHPMRPGSTAVMFVLGIFCCWRVFAPPWVSFLSAHQFWAHRQAPPPA